MNLVKCSFFYFTLVIKFNAKYFYLNDSKIQKQCAEGAQKSAQFFELCYHLDLLISI